MNVFVLVHTKQDFADWCNRRNVNPIAAKPVTDPLELMGKIKPEDQLFDARTAPTIAPPRQVA
jgi:hypothetical protein